MTNRKKYPVIQINDGSWYVLANFSRDICCDCGLVHDTDFKLDNGRIMFRTRVNVKATDAQRKEHGITITRSKS